MGQAGDEMAESEIIGTRPNLKAYPRLMEAKP